MSLFFKKISSDNMVKIHDLKDSIMLETGKNLEKSLKLKKN